MTPPRGLASNKDGLLRAVADMPRYDSAYERERMEEAALRDHPGSRADWPRGLLDAYVSEMLRAKHEFITRVIHAAPNEQKLKELARLYLGPGMATMFQRANGSVDYGKVSVAYMTPNRRQAGRTIARAATRAMLSPHTAMGRRRLTREFQRMAN